MATTFIDRTDTQSAGISAQQLEKGQPAVFEVEFSTGTTRQFQSEEGVRDAILLGEVSRTSLIRKVGASVSDQATTVEIWAKSKPKLRALYAPVWALTMKGALVGLIVVGALKSLDTLIGLFAVNPGAAIVWLLLGAGLISPKWKLQLMAGALYLSFQSGVSFSLLWGAWLGVFAFAAVFGTSAGMAVGTIIGFQRLNRLPKAPDAREGRRPLVLGLAIPLTAFAVAATVYFQVLMPAVLKLVSRQ